MEALKRAWERIKGLKKRTKIILGIILIIVIFILIPLFKPNQPTYETGMVKRGDVVEEVSANGMVQAINEIDLRFKTSGTIERILVKVGGIVKKGAYLVSLDSGTVYSQYLQAQASYSQAKAKLDQLLAGTSAEEIKVAEQVLKNAKIALQDARDKAENDLNQDHSSALVQLINSSNKCNKAIADLSDIKRTYFIDTTGITTTINEKQGQAEEAFLGITSLNIKGAQEYVKVAIDDPTHENINSALSKMWTALQKASDLLEYIKTAINDPIYRNAVSSDDETIINSDATDIGTAFVNITTAQADIANQRISNQVNINAAEATYNKAKVDLEELQASPRGVDVAVYQADVDKYRANLAEYAKKLSDASIVAPFDGMVAKVDAKIGEVITATEKVIVSLISPKGLQIQADVPETDISKVSLTNPVSIVLDALPEKTFTGEILEIDSSKTLIDGVVYYKVKILLLGDEQRIRSGMSGDVTIQTDEKTNALQVPQRAVITKNNQKIVRVLNGNKIEERKVIVGIKGSRGEIEIIGGLTEGEKIITFMKNEKK